MGNQDYLNYPVSRPSTDYSQGMTSYNGNGGAAVSGDTSGGDTSSVLPWVRAGIAGVGLLASLYGNYKSQSAADRNFEGQLRQFDRQQAIDDETRRRQIAQQAIENQIGSKAMVDAEEQNRLARYQNYYRGIGL